MKSIALNLMGVEADTIKNISIDNDIDGEGETKEVIEVSTKSGDFEFETKHDRKFGGICLTIKGDGLLVVLEQGPGIKRSLRTISGVSTVKGTGDEFVAMTDFGELHIVLNKFNGIIASLKAEKTKELEFRVWADNPHE